MGKKAEKQGEMMKRDCRLPIDVPQLIVVIIGKEPELWRDLLIRGGDDCANSEFEERDEFEGVEKMAEHGREGA